MGWPLRDLVAPTSAAVRLAVSLLVLMALLVPAPARAQVPAVEREALIALYEATNGQAWPNRANWRNADDTDFNAVGTECSWAGVECTFGVRVGGLRLSRNGLSGFIPLELGNLVLLGARLGDDPPNGVLDLTGNQLNGTIPPTLGKLRALREMFLGSNQLTGDIPPELGSLVLTWVVLRSNRLSGAIPATLIKWHLVTLDLSFNDLTGEIPDTWPDDAILSTLDLSSNRLTGSLPATLGHLNTLRGLRLNSNRFTGSIPATLANLTSLSVDLRWNGLHTTDPTLRDFLNARHTGGDWESTQTVPAVGFAAGSATQTSVVLSWTPILYTGDSGGYRVSASTAFGGPYTTLMTTASKSVSSATVASLSPGTTYYFVLESVTDPHANNKNTVVSEPTEEVTATTSPWPGLSHPLSVTTAGASVGEVNSSPPGIHCGGLCRATFLDAEVVTLTATPRPGATFRGWSGDCSGEMPTCQVTMDAERSVTATFMSAFNTVTPCRVFDSRDAFLGGPRPLAAGSSAPVPIAGQCGIPAEATAVSVNVTATEPTDAGHLTVFPHPGPRPPVSMLNYQPGATRASNAIVALGASGAVGVFAGQGSGSVHVIVDVNGFVQ